MQHRNHWACFRCSSACWSNSVCLFTRLQSRTRLPCCLQNGWVRLIVRHLYSRFSLLSFSGWVGIHNICIDGLNARVIPWPGVFLLRQGDGNCSLHLLHAQLFLHFGNLNISTPYFPVTSCHVPEGSPVGPSIQYSGICLAPRHTWQKVLGAPCRAFSSILANLAALGKDSLSTEPLRKHKFSNAD